VNNVYKILRAIARLQRIQARIRTTRAAAREATSLLDLVVILADLRETEEALRTVVRQATELFTTGQEFLADLRTSTATRAELITTLRALVREANALVEELRAIVATQQRGAPPEGPLPEMAVEPPANEGHEQEEGASS